MKDTLGHRGEGGVGLRVRPQERFSVAQLVVVHNDVGWARGILRHGGDGGEGAWVQPVIEPAWLTLANTIRKLITGLFVGTT